MGFNSLRFLALIIKLKSNLLFGVQTILFCSPSINCIWNDPPLFLKNQTTQGRGEGDGIKSDLSAILLFCCIDKAASIFWLGIALKGSSIMNNKSIMSMEHVQQLQLSFIQEKRVARLTFF